MKRMRILGLTLLALFALGAFATSMASAEEGVLPQQGAKVFKIKGGKATLETLRSEEPAIICQANTGEGTFLAGSDQHAVGTLDFTGCKASIAGVQSLGDAKETILSKVLFLVCLVEPKQLIFGVLIQPIQTEHLEVPLTKQLVLVKGAVIAENESGNSGTEFKMKLEGTKGDQKHALECEINGTVFTHTFEAALDTNTDEMASENAAATVTFGEKVEFMDT